MRLKTSSTLLSITVSFDSVFSRFHNYLFSVYSSQWKQEYTNTTVIFFSLECGGGEISLLMYF